ncbi:MAG: DUF2442 domain-containing protein [Ignavibacteriae bacterium]|nr:DUF2442 domain-containing protein [Ignavibacteriota bacterium]
MEYPNLIEVKPIEPLKLCLYYDNGEERLIDMSKYMKSDYFRQLMNWDYFIKVKVKSEVVSWPNEQDIAPETLYLDSVKIN